MKQGAHVSVGNDPNRDQRRYVGRTERVASSSGWRAGSEAGENNVEDVEDVDAEDEDGGERQRG